MTVSNIGYNGRDLIVKIGSVKIAGVQSKEITRPRSAVDVTNDDCDGWKRVLPKPGMRSSAISIKGVCTGEGWGILRNMWDNDTAYQTVTVTHPDGSTETGSAFISALSDSGDHDGAVTFSMTLDFTDVIVSNEISI